MCLDLILRWIRYPSQPVFSTFHDPNDPYANQCISDLLMMIPSSTLYMWTSWIALEWWVWGSLPWPHSMLFLFSLFSQIMRLVWNTASLWLARHTIKFIHTDSSRQYPTPKRYMCLSCLSSQPIYQAKTNLLIVPDNLVDQWISEIHKHFVDDSLSICVYQGVGKIMNDIELHHRIFSFYFIEQ